ncbi:MAG: ATP-binding protein [Sphaerochaeta sp.]|nr:ATP-binding protein [Sphaerochaeta sp.]
MGKNYVIVHDGRVSSLHLLQSIQGDLTKIATNTRKSIIPTKNFFIVTVPPDDSATFILEYVDKKIPFINPKVVEYEQWGKSIGLEYALFFGAKMVLIILVLLLLALSLATCRIKVTYGITEKHTMHKSLVGWSLAPLFFHMALCCIGYYAPPFQGKIYGNVLQVSLLFSLLAATGLYLYGSFRYFLVVLHHQRRTQQSHIKELTALQIQKLSMIEQLSKTIASENLGELFNFLESIASSASLITEGMSGAGILSLAQSIERRINEFIATLQHTYHACIPTDRISDQQVYRYHAPLFVEEKACTHTVAFYDFDPISIANNTSILQAHAIKGIQYSDQDSLVQDFEKGEIELLILNPASTGTDCFTLCKKIRATKSALEFPILMITNYCSFFIMQQGYDAEINDCIISPYSSSELVSRVHALIGQRSIYEKNAELTISENEKKTFLYFITHNINSPLTCIVNQVDDIIESEHVSSDTLGAIEAIGQAADEINLIIQNVLTSYMLHDGYFICMPQMVVFEELLALLVKGIEHKAKGKNQTVVWSVHDLPKTITYDRTSLWGILNNLLDNASKFSPASSQIMFSTKKHQGDLLLQVIDQGPGIPQAELPYLFTATKKISNKPTAGENSIGLGLHVAYRLARLNGSTLSYQSQDGGGSCFTLSIPLKEAVE